MTRLTDPDYLRDALGSLSQLSPGYPFSLLAARRTAFQKQVNIQNLNDYLWECEDVPTDAVTDEQDERNSREFPY